MLFSPAIFFLLFSSRPPPIGCSFISRSCIGSSHSFRLCLSVSMHEYDVYRQPIDTIDRHEYDVYRHPIDTINSIDTIDSIDTICLCCVYRHYRQHRQQRHYRQPLETQSVMTWLVLCSCNPLTKHI